MPHWLISWLSFISEGRQLAKMYRLKAPTNTHADDNTNSRMYQLWSQWTTVSLEHDFTRTVFGAKNL